MNTLLLKDDEYGLKYSAELIKNGEIVAFPTETVYGLGADATNESAVRKIFEAKGRPSDNPLIVHLHDFNEAVRYTKYIPEIAFRVAEKFCPGAITLVLPKNDKIASERKMQVGTGDRSERIRTYNYPQGRFTDHRINLTIYRLEDLLNGNLDEVFDALATADQTEKLASQEY